jgi:Domain of unknown function (DUF4389)
MSADNTLIDRKETAIRILFTVLFIVIVERIIEAVLVLVILFELVYTLITKHPPGARVRSFANRTLSYAYHIMRYLTYNEPEVPFPFADFPPEVEPPASLQQGSTGDADHG